MKKFGFSRKDKDGGDRSKNPSPANANPYAVNSAPADPYAASPPPAYQGGAPSGNDGYRPDKTPSYTSSQNGGGSDRNGGGDRFAPSGGSQAGYGSNRFQSQDQGSDSGGSRYGSGGYGGFGGAPAGGSNRYGGGAAEAAPPSRYGGGAPDAGPVAAPSTSRYGGGAADAAPSTSRYGGGPAPPSNSRYGAGPAPGPNRFGAGPSPAGAGQYAPVEGASRYGAAPPTAGAPGNRYGGAPAAYGAEQDAAPPPSTWESGRGEGEPQGYGAYQDRQLTAEEQEEEDVLGTKQEIRAIKQSDVSSTRNALRIAQMAEESGRGTLERLQQQGERIHNTERNLDLASNQNRLAAEKAREIKTLNRSMFAVHVSNPFTSGKRVKEREEEVLSQAQEDRARRDATRNAAWSSNERSQKLGMQLNKAGAPATGKSLADRAKYQFEADSEDEDMENEIDGNLDLLHGAAKRMNMVAGAMGSEIESQNRHIERIGGKVDRVDDEIALNRSRLDRIK